MAGVEFASIIFLLSSLCLLIFLFAFIRFIYAFWWTPIRLQRMMKRQGMKCFSYSFPHGNSKEIAEMKSETLSKPMEYVSHNIFGRIEPHLYSWLNVYGKTFVNWYGPIANLVVTEVGLVKEIFIRDPDYQKLETTGVMKMLVGDGLVASKGEKWAKQRKLANHTFHAESLKSMTPAMIASVEIMLERWKQHEGKEIEVFEEFELLTSEIISRTAFGSSYLEGRDIFEKLKRISVIFFSGTLKIRFPGLSRVFKSEGEIEAEKLEQIAYNSILRIIEKREKASTMSGESGSFGTDFLGLLLKAKNDADENNRITVQDVVDECKTFYLAGQETAATALAWIIFLLGIHTDWQEKARQEVFDVFGQEKPKADGFQKLKTMSMIIHETLRLYPLAPVFLREVKKETRLGKFILPAKMFVTIPTLALHHDTQIWGDDTHVFKPERFAQGVMSATKNNPAAFIPFGFGPRTCVGSNFATNEVKTALSMILQRYSFTLSPSYIHAPIQIATVRPQYGVPVKFHPL